MVIEMAVSEARARLGDVLDTARVRRQPVFLTRHGKRVGVVQGIEQWENTHGTEQPAPRADVSQQIADLRALAAAMIAPDIPPLLDASTLYETREPRL